MENSDGSNEKIDEVDKNEIIASFERMNIGFLNNDFTEYYTTLADKVVVVDGYIGEIYKSKAAFVAQLTKAQEMLYLDVKGWKINEIKLSQNIAVVRAEYIAIFIKNKINRIESHGDWHMVWEKDILGEWKIIMEIFYDKKAFS